MPPSIAKRLLFPQLQADVLPPLFSSQVPSELNSECYDFIALALRAFVTPWWSKISRYDRDFLPEITHILSQVIPHLEKRILAADIPNLILRDFPTIISQHYIDYRNGKAKLHSTYSASSFQLLFHHSQPHIAVSPEGQLDPEYYRYMIDFILSALLPPEHYTPEAERTIVREIILKVVLQDVFPKITQPWFILKLISDPIPLHPAQSVNPPRSPAQSSPLSFHSIIVLILSAIQTFSGICITLIESYKHILNTIKRVNQRTHLRPPSPTSQNSQDSPSSEHSHSQSNLAMPGLRMFSHIILGDDRYSSRLLFSNIYILIASFSSFIDRLLMYTVTTGLSSPDLLLTVIRTLKKTMFPNGYPVPAAPPPTPEEQEAMRNKIVHFVPRGTAAHLMRLFCGPDPSTTVSDALEPLSDASCNVHLLAFLLDRIVFTLFPEFANGLEVSPQPSPS